MSSCSNSSNLLGNVNINDISGSGARLLMTLPISGFSGGRASEYLGDDGITYGDAVRYNAATFHATDEASGGKYVKAKADTPANSEVIGIVESVDVGSDVVVVILNGQINFPEDKLITATHIDAEAGITGSAGGNDVYFLSAVTGGMIQNLAPTEPTQVIKPVYQVAPDDPFTGQVVNYIGYQAGGQIVASDDMDQPNGSLTFVPKNFINGNSIGRDSGRGWHKMGSSFNLNVAYGDTYLNAYGDVGHICETLVRIYTRETPTRNMIDTRCTFKNGGKTLLVGTITSIDISSSSIECSFSSTYFNKLESAIVSGRNISIRNGSLLTIADRAFEYQTYTWPSLTKNNPLLSIRVTDGEKEMDLPLDVLIFNPRDTEAGNGKSRETHAVSMPTRVEVEQLTATSVIVENSTVKITNLADAINSMNDKITTIKTKLNLDDTAVTEIEKK